MRINHNIMAANTQRQLAAGSANSAKSMEKLSSGLRINKAGDDAAGLAISEKMRSQIRGLTQASRNAQDGISMIQTAEGALNETQSILQRMRELTVQANNGTNTSEDVSKIKLEMDELTKEINGISDRTEFNGKKLLTGTVGLKLESTGGGSATTDTNMGLAGATFDVSGAEAGKTYTLTNVEGSNNISLTDGNVTQILTLGAGASVSANSTLDFDKLGIKISFGGATSFGTAGGTEVNAVAGLAIVTEDDATVAGKAAVQIGANASQTLDISISDMRANQLGTVGLKVSGLDVTKFDVAATSFDNQLATIDKAITDVSGERAKLGAYQNRLEHTIANLDTSSENLQSAESRIRDVDMAKEMMEFTKNNILSQAATAMLAQANQAPQGVLQLLR